MREYEYYRATIEGLTQNYGDADIIRISDIKKKNNLDIRTLNKMIKDLKIPVIFDHYINKHALAQAMSKMSK